MANDTEKQGRSRFLDVIRCGTTGFEDGCLLQDRLAAEIRAGQRHETLLLLEHPHVITLGLSGKPDNILASAAELSRRGIAVRRIRRGGDATYHGFGQLIGYPLILFQPGNRAVKNFMRDIEEALLRALADFSIGANRKPGLTGVFVGDAKIASIGVGIRDRVSRHGFALNVSTDLGYFDLIVACGLPGVRQTSIQVLLGRNVSLDEAAERVEARFLEVFGRVAGTATLPGRA